jgi:hypothetical protein
MSAPANLSRAGAHPLRRRIALAAYGRESVASVALARELDAKLGDVAYHVGVMRDAGLLELVDLVPVRGAQRHDYRLTPAGEELAGEAARAGVGPGLPPAARVRLELDVAIRAADEALERIDELGLEDEVRGRVRRDVGTARAQLLDAQGEVDPLVGAPA